MKSTNYDMVGGASSLIRVYETCSELEQNIHRKGSGRPGT